MLVRINKSCGNYGLVRNGVIVPKNFASGAFEVSDQEGNHMINRGIASAVGTTPTAEAATQTAEPAPKVKTKKPRRKPVRQEMPDTAPTVNAADAIL